jgi:Asp-tRNA(Asn)/Glu-tRNA(Gln) amidotransferase A subunit family amidase
MTPAHGDERLCLAPVAELVPAISGRSLSPVELLDAIVARIEAVEPSVHAFVTLDLERAYDAARAKADRLARGGQAGPLEGIPVGIKDLVPTAGLRTTNGTPFFIDDVPDHDAVEVERLRAAGCVIIGKTNTPAWGLKEMCENLVAEATRNPWDLTRTPGGSSGGAGAAVAAGYGPIAHGTDGAGSIRIPAAWCGVFGIKPSLGRVPLWPTPDIWGARIHAGPLARHVRDAAVMLEAMAGPDPRDPLSIDEPADGFVAACGAPIAGRRLAWCADLGFAPVDDEVRMATRQAAAVFEELGAIVEEVDDPGWGDPTWWHRILYRGSAANRLAPLAAAHPEWIDPSVQEIIDLGLAITASEYVAALGERTQFYSRAQQFMSAYDGLLTPTMPCEAWAYDAPPPLVGDAEITAVAGGRWPLVYAFSGTGGPAATVPCGFGSGGLPIGLQIVAPWHQDAWCLSLAAAFEAARPWQHHRPPITAATPG